VAEILKCRNVKRNRRNDTYTTCVDKSVLSKSDELIYLYGVHCRSCIHGRNVRCLEDDRVILNRVVRGCASLRLWY
jgi:hypothetical protein